ncbi:integumentary mucin C.1-like isoform X2 [Haliotis rufescens]|uniref:integumentary mucin C.1-like isoform X2 n=1 Tax=Haliotis rufescens TaxID=6454 RepID=UPI00201F44E6|nr:integumentary mucin C.1-like isoform X2 [Haliotis rufescens]
MKTVFLILSFQVAIVGAEHYPQAGLECYKCHKYDHHHHDDRCHVQHCHDDEFCEIDMGLDDIVDGKCKPLKDFNHCLHDMKTWCPDFRTLFYYGRCKFCCDDAECVNQALHISVDPFGSTQPPPTTPSSPDCVDLMPGCATTDNVCSNTLAPVVCKKFCSFCGVPSPTSSTSTTSTTNQPTTTTAKPTSTLPPCRDHMKEDQCHILPNICSDKLAGDICPAFCGLCQKVKPTPSLPLCTSTTREDNCVKVPNICSDPAAPFFCPEFCGICTRQVTGRTGGTPTATITSSQANTVLPTTPSTSTGTARTGGTSTAAITSSSATTVLPATPSTTITVTLGGRTCSDHSPICSSIADICHNKLGPQLCEKTCRSCVSGLSSTLPASASVQTSNSSMTPSATHPAGPVSPSTSGIPTPPARSCYLCGNYSTFDPCTLAELTLGVPQPCPSGQYCMTDLFTMLDGSEKVFKRCVNHRMCLRKWYAETSDISVCTDFKRSNNVLDLTCHFCCVGDNCNTKIIPETHVLFKP